MLATGCSCLYFYDYEWRSMQFVRTIKLIVLDTICAIKINC